MAIWNRVGSAVAHNTWDVTVDDVGKRVVESQKKTISHNYSNAANWQGDVSNNGVFASMRERFLSEPNSPQGKLSRDGKTSKLVETQQGVGNRYANFRGNLNVARENLKSNISELEEGLKAAQGDEAVKAYQNALKGARKEKSSLGTKELLSYGQQAGAHALRTMKWTQEGPMMDRVKKTAAVGGAYMGANVALRGLSGGGVTYNNDGQRDIAGIPFF